MASADANTPDPIIHGKPLSFSPGNHTYRWGKERVPSVSAIVKRLDKGDALINWAANCAADEMMQWITKAALSEKVDFEEALQAADNSRTAHTRIRDAAGDVGTKLHDYAKDYMRGKVALLPPDARVIRVAGAFRDWHAENVFSDFRLERRVYSAKWRFAGTPDFFGKFNGQLAVLDYKTGKGIYSEQWIQLMAYKLALEEEYGIVGIKRWIIHLSKETGLCRAISCAQRDDEVDRDLLISLIDVDRHVRQMKALEKAA